MTFTPVDAATAVGEQSTLLSLPSRAERNSQQHLLAGTVFVHTWPTRWSRRRLRFSPPEASGDSVMRPPSGGGALVSGSP